MGIQALVDSIQTLATAYNQEYASGPILAFNDMSLLNGGKFDISGRWTGDHDTHRVGLNVDLRTRGLGVEDLDGEKRRWLMEEIEDIFGREVSEEHYGENNWHWHLTYFQVDQKQRPQNDN